MVSQWATFANRPLSFREDDGQGHFGGENAPGVVAAERNHGYRVPGSELLVDVSGVCLAARQARGTLRHCGAGTVESAERQDVELAHQVDCGSSSQMLLDLVVRNFSGIADTVVQTIGPFIERGAVAAVGEGPEAGRASGDIARRSGGRSICARTWTVGVQ